MKNWPIWIPYPNAWASGFTLLVMREVFLANSQWLSTLVSWVSRIMPQKFVPLLLLGVILTPIGLVAIAHHTLHSILNQYFPESKAPESEQVKGFFPGLMSWWEGLYSWLVILLASIITVPLAIAILQPDQLSSFWLWLLNTRPFFSPVSILWLLIAAYLYHFEGLVRNHLMTLRR